MEREREGQWDARVEGQREKWDMGTGSEEISPKVVERERRPHLMGEMGSSPDGGGCGNNIRQCAKKWAKTQKMPK